MESRPIECNQFPQEYPTRMHLVMDILKLEMRLKYMHNRREIFAVAKRGSHGF